MKRIINSKGFLVILFFLVAVNILIFSFQKRPVKSKEQAEMADAEASYDKYAKTDEGKRISLDSLSLLHDNGISAYSFDKDKYLAVRFSELNCETCVQNIFTLLHKDSTIDANRIILLVDYKSEAFLRTFLRVNVITYPVFRYFSDKSVLNTDKMGSPYVFIVDRDGNLHDFFIPVKEDQERTISYLERIKKII